MLSDRVQVGDAAGNAGLPRKHGHRREVGVGDQVGVSLLATHDGGVAKIGAHDRRAEREPVPGSALELPYGHVFAPRHAVQIGVEHPHASHGIVGQLGRPGHEFLFLNHDYSFPPAPPAEFSGRSVAASAKKASKRRKAHSLAASSHSGGAASNRAPSSIPSSARLSVSTPAQPATISTVLSGWNCTPKCGPNRNACTASAVRATSTAPGGVVKRS